jgi:hypothetical protein
MVTSSTDAPTDAPLPCPRCGGEVTERFYGPCASCRAELRATLGSDGHQLDDVGYDPKMNVTPNAVAVKD